MSKRRVLRWSMYIGLGAGLFWPSGMAISGSIPWSYAIVATSMFVMGAIIGIGLFITEIVLGENANSSRNNPSAS
jgi:hypothetical protein